MTRYFCVHGHFYQPPRENPWTGKIDPQPSAAPFDNWNIRIARECYLSNTQAKVFNPDGSISHTVNNYQYLSFNFGPTLLRWFDQAFPKMNEKLVEADQESIQRFGFGTAMAQAFHHSILPLADRADKRAEIAWGIADFEHRFNRAPQGMWLAETAVDTETLEVLVDHGVEFTILAPRQAKCVSKLGSDHWESVTAETVDISQPYWCELPSGKRIALFFYHGDLAMEVAFRGALNNGEAFAHRIKDICNSLPDERLLHFATDGETYGHHHRYGEMAMAYCFETLDKMDGVEPINYAAYLHRFPPTHRVQIHERSSWSCVHGVGRWSENCGCVIDPSRKGFQKWRVHLRKALNRLRDTTRTLFLEHCYKLVDDPYVLRNGWMEATLKDKTEQWMNECAGRELSSEEHEELRFWMRHQTLALMMFTSCGWFFDEADGIEPRQILQYAKKLIELTQEKVEWPFERTFLDTLSRISKKENGRVTGMEMWESL